MTAAAAEYYFRFPICWCHSIRKIKVYQQTKFRRHISIYEWDITTSVVEKQTSAILEFYFRFRCQPFCRNLLFFQRVWGSFTKNALYKFTVIILHQATAFRPNRSTHCGNMTSYPFLKMAGAAAQYYFRYRICWSHCLRKVNIYQPTKFRRHTSIHGWDVTTSVFDKQTSAILEFYFQFRSRPVGRNLHVILHRLNRSTHCGNMTSYPFLKMAAATCKHYFRFRICWRHCLQKVKVY